MPSPNPHPSITVLGRITHHSPSLNATNTQNNQSWQRCQEALGRGWARSAHRRACRPMHIYIPGMLPQARRPPWESPTH